MRDVFQFVPGYRHYIYSSGREPLFFLLLGFLLTFVAVRAYTRTARARGWRSGSVGGTHLHHAVPGVIATLAAGTAIVAFRPSGDAMLVLSALFGCGAALILDEFALVLHLDDVYWTDEGRGSIEATLMGFSFALILLLATLPLSSDPGRDVPHWVIGGVITANMCFALISFLKGKAKLGAFGIFVPALAIIGATRLAKPTSLWARRFYPPAKRKRSQARSVRYHQRYAHLRHRFYDAIGGTPHLDHNQKRPS